MHDTIKLFPLRFFFSSWIFRVHSHDEACVSMCQNLCTIGSFDFFSYVHGYVHDVQKILCTLCTYVLLYKDFQQHLENAMSNSSYSINTKKIATAN